ncbi:MAG: hypothetical protein FWD59_04820, partial [Micrococcales bacterium]|nr:hypothetical protein [Micrococcales bacterium]
TVSVARVAESKSKGAATIVGKVLDAKGKPVKAGFVEVWDKTGRKKVDTGKPVAVARISSKGTYRVTGLEPSTSYFVAAAVPGHLMTWVSNRVANHPKLIKVSKGATVTGAGTATTTVPTINLIKGGLTISGKIAGHRKSDKVTALACTMTRSVGMDQMQEREMDRAYCFRGHVSPDGSYMIPGVSASVIEVSVSSAVARRIAIVDGAAAVEKATEKQVPGQPWTGKTKLSFPALARTKGPSVNLPTVGMRGHYAVGFSLHADIEPPFVTNPASISVVWTDGMRILGRGQSLPLTKTMRYGYAQAIVVASLPDRDVASWRVGQVDFFGLPEVGTLPIPGVIDKVGGPSAFAGNPLAAEDVWGTTYTVEGPPPGWRYDYQWFCNWDPIPGAVGKTYTTTAADADTECYIQVELTVTGPKGEWDTAVVAYPMIGVLSHVINTRATAVRGAGAVGKTLEVINPPADEFKITYQWLRNGRKIKGATGLTYTLTAADKGRVMSVWLTSQRSGYRPADPEIGRVLLGPVKPEVSAWVPWKKALTSQNVRLPIGVVLAHNPLRDTVGLEGTIKVKVGPKSVSHTLRERDHGWTRVTLPKLPRGEHKVTVTFIPKDKAVAKATVTEKKKLRVR